jgi:putative ABC transport system substrate-binding protein
MTIRIGRREFVAALGGARIALPFPARAQQPAMPVVGFLYAGAPEASASVVTAFRKGLSEAGNVEGQNLAIEYRWAHNDNARLPELATDLVRRRVAVIVTLGSTPAALAAKAATATIPIVFSVAGDPVQSGLVASLNRPGGNVTGVSYISTELAAKRLGLLHELLPEATRIAVLVNPNNPFTKPVISDLQTAASAIRLQIEVFTATTNGEIDTAFASLGQKRADALLLSPDLLFTNRRIQIVTLAAHHRVPAIYSVREYVEAGGLISYGSNLADQYH